MTKSLILFLLVAASLAKADEILPITVKTLDIVESSSKSVQENLDRNILTANVKDERNLKFDSLTFKNQARLPRFASIKSNEVNVRAGPNLQSKIDWVFIQKGEPVEILLEYEQWRKVRDVKGEGGWVHASVLSNKRAVVIIAEDTIPLLDSANINAKIVAKLAPNVRCQLDKSVQDWCKIKCAKYKGWVQRKVLWGAYVDEKF